MPTFIVIILYKTEDALPAFLDSLLAQTARDWRVVAIDNASPDGSAAVLDALADPRIEVIRNGGNTGFARAANQGVRRAHAQGAEVMVLMNIDTSFGPAFLAELVAARARLGADVLTPRIMYSDSPDAGGYAGGHFDRRWVFVNVNEPFDPADTRASRVVEYASGCCLLLTRGAGCSRAGSWKGSTMTTGLSRLSYRA